MTPGLGQPPVGTTTSIHCLRSAVNACSRRIKGHAQPSETYTHFATAHEIYVHTTKKKNVRWRRCCSFMLLVADKMLPNLDLTANRLCNTRWQCQFYHIMYILRIYTRIYKTCNNRRKKTPENPFFTNRLITFKWYCERRAAHICQARRATVTTIDSFSLLS